MYRLLYVNMAAVRGVPCPLHHCTKLLSLYSSRKAATNLQSVRFRWKPPDPESIIHPTFAQRLSDWKRQHETVPASDGINIGLPFVSSTNDNTRLQKLRQWSKVKAERESAARHKQLKIDFDEMREEWNKESRPRHISRIAKHYGIFQDMFDGAHFNPTVPLEVMYDYDEEFLNPVCYGNVIPASETEVKPFVEFESDEGSLWTLVMSSPDGNLEENGKELLHWMVGNIPGNDIEKGETLCHYLQPFPPKGVGYLRYVFVLYKQRGPLDFSAFQKSQECYSLQERSFSTLDFYRQFEEDVTPAGLVFFQSLWDKTVRGVFHNVLNMPEPKFEFIHPPEYFPEQEDIPHKQPFNMYLDNYRDVKDLQEEVIKYKLHEKDPLAPPKPRPKFNNVDLLLNTSSWLRCKIQDVRLGKGRWKALYEDPKE